jgi:uncharacterized protein (TIGR02147 family)
MHDISSYTDYRTLIADYYKSRKESDPSFSFQRFAERAGFRTKTYLHKVINGDKDLSKRSVFAVGRAMGLSKRQAEYFEALVHFNQARSVDEREHYFVELQSLGKRHGAVKLRESQFAYFSNWYYPVVRELVAIMDFRGDHVTLARAVSPPIAPRQARRAVDVLLELGLITRSGRGGYLPADKSVTTGDEVVSFAVQKFQRENLALASESIDRHSRDTRDLSTLTVGITDKGFERVREEIRAFRKRLVAIAEDDEPADRVYQINFQFFPLSRPVNKDGSR